MAGKIDPPTGKKELSLEEPHFGVSVEFECSVNRRTILHLHYSESGTGSRAAVASKESEYPNDLRGVKSLLSELFVKFSVLARALSRRK